MRAARILNPPVFFEGISPCVICADLSANWQIPHLPIKQNPAVCLLFIYLFILAPHKLDRQSLLKKF